MILRAESDQTAAMNIFYKASVYSLRSEGMIPTPLNHTTQLIFLLARTTSCVNLERTSNSGDAAFEISFAFVVVINVH